MTKEELYKATLEKMANEGNLEAKLALSLASNIPCRNTVNNSDAIHALKNANVLLQNAIEENSKSWRRATDDYINNAQNKIIEAIVLIK